MGFHGFPGLSVIFHTILQYSTKFRFIPAYSILFHNIPFFHTWVHVGPFVGVPQVGLCLSLLVTGVSHGCLCGLVCPTQNDIMLSEEQRMCSSLYLRDKITDKSPENTTCSPYARQRLIWKDRGRGVSVSFGCYGK